MSYPSRRAYADASELGHATYDDYQDFSRHPFQYREHEVRHKVTVTRYRVQTSGESTTSYHDRRDDSAYDSHPSSSSYHTIPNEGYTDPNPRLRGDSRRPEKSFKYFDADYTYPDSPKRESRRTGPQRDDRHGQPDRQYSSDNDTMPEKRNPKPQSSAEEQRGYTSYARANQSQQKGLKPAQKGRYSGIPRSHGGSKHVRSDKPSQEKPNNSSGRREENHYDSRSNTCRQEDSRSNRNGPYHEGCEQSYHQQSPKPSQPKEPKPTSRDCHASEPKSYRDQKFATKGKPGSGSSRRRDEPHSIRSESRRGGNARSNRKDQSNEMPRPQSEAEDNFQNFYTTLGISHLATDVEIKRAARRRRVEVHPDKLKTLGMSDSELFMIDAGAAKVGQAADVLQNPELKLNYDRELYAAKGWGWFG